MLDETTKQKLKKTCIPSPKFLPTFKMNLSLSLSLIKPEKFQLPLID
jgi:hypothetical protein